MANSVQIPDALTSGSPVAAPLVPDEFLCPIGMGLMTDPVIASDGQTYNRPELLEWLKVRQISPLTNEPITAAGLVRNYALAAAIERFRATLPPDAVVAASKPPESKRTVKRFSLKKRGQRVWIGTDFKEFVESFFIGVLDNSGSMGSAGREATATDSEGGNYSRNDLTKHSMKTVATMLAERNEIVPTHLSVIKFNTQASIVMPMRQMTQENLKAANAAIDTIQPEGCTNIWDGLRIALDMAARTARFHPDANIQIFFLTDGEPSQDLLPPEGIQQSLVRKLAQIKAPVVLHAFGFGYSLDTQLLRTIASLGGGIYGYIPDCRMSGTVFIHAVAAALATVARNVVVRHAGTEYVVGNLAAGQEKTFVLSQPDAGGSSSMAEVVYDCDMTQAVVLEDDPDRETMFEDACDSVRKQIENVLNNFTRWSCVAMESFHTLRDGLVSQAVKRGGGAADTTASAASRALCNLIDDIDHKEDGKGQLIKAVSREDWYASWGKNHLVSYALALARQQCVNFKDLALQNFMPSSVREIREMGSTIFDNLPPPVPSIRSYSGGGQTRMVSSMAVFNNADAGCWAGWCRVQLADGTCKFTSELEPGDFLDGGHRIVCVVQTKLTKPVQMLQNEQLSITPWHPVKLTYANNPTWVFPCEEQELLDLAPREEFNQYVYNLVLESGHTVRIGGYDVCTLGHFFEGPVIGHDYYGTYKVIEDLEKMPGWREGRVTLTPENVVRGQEGRVVGISPKV